jgi:hypothetical protein
MNLLTKNLRARQHTLEAGNKNLASLVVNGERQASRGESWDEFKTRLAAKWTKAA